MKEWIIEDDFLDEETKMSADGQGYLRELIRCKDCKYRDEFGRCNLFKQFTPHVLENGYCSDAKRKKE